MLTFSDSRFLLSRNPKEPPFYDLISALQVSSEMCSRNQYMREISRRSSSDNIN